MDSVSILYNLRKLLPEVDIVNPVVQNIIHSEVSREEKAQKVLSHHFKLKTSVHAYYSKQNLLIMEAKLIHKVFPSRDFQAIHDQLRALVDMPNRKEIVLRLLCLSNDHTNPPAKRPNVQYLDSMNNNQPLIKVRKVEELVTVTSVPSSSERNAVPFADRAYFPDEKEATVTASSTSINNVPSTDNGFFRRETLATATCVPSSTIQDKNYVPVHDHVSFPWDKPATVTSSNVDKAVIDEKNEPSSTVMNGYEIPDIMEHFDLPVVNLFPMPEGNAELEVLEAQLPYANEETVESSTGIEGTLVNSTEGGVNRTNSTDSTSSKDSNCTVISLDQSDEGPQIVSDGSSEVPRDSQDSNRTEIYPLDETMIDSSAIPATQQRTVTMVGPTIIRINKIFNAGIKGSEERAGNEDTVQREAQIVDEPFNNAPSTSRQDTTTMNNGIADFNLIDYVREITNAQEEVVRKNCKKLNLRPNVKPLPFLLNMLIDNILSNVVDSEDSDVEHLPDIASERELDSAMGVPVEQNVEATNAPSTEGAGVQSVETPMDEDGDVDKQLVQHLCLVFSDACPKYIKRLCRGKVNNNEVLDNLVTEILSTNGQYPKRPQPAPEPEFIPENQLEILKEFLPDADPDYLSMMLDKFEGKPELVKSFLNDAMEKRNYPTLKDYQRRQQLSAQQKQYTTEFNVENFIKLIPDPEKFFSDPSRKIKISNADSHYILVFMRNKFNRIHLRTIQSVFSKNQCDVAKTIRDLEKAMTESQYIMKSVRRSIEMPNNIENIPLLQELAYYTHKTEIELYLFHQIQKEETERQEAKNNGLLKTCNCCYDEEVLPKDIYRCENGCEFCKSCIVKSSEVLFGEGKLAFPCLSNCSSSFSLQTLQAVLCPKLFSKIAQKKALEEIKAAGIEELEVCPFCDFATIPAEGYNIFTCMNPECMKESCRMCKEPSHIPLRCDEIEKDEDVRARTFVENKMTEALLKKCYKCGVKFFKEEGCNKMTCSCGAQMCYVCGKPVDSYKHFNGNGGDRLDLCPLYSDTNVLNKQNVLKGAEQAKAEIGNVNLKHDPTTDVNKHYQERKQMFPQNHLLHAGAFVLPDHQNVARQVVNNIPPPRGAAFIIEHRVNNMQPVFQNIPRQPINNPPHNAVWQRDQGIRNGLMVNNRMYPPVALGLPRPRTNINQQQPMMNVPEPPINRPQIPFPHM